MISKRDSPPLWKNALPNSLSGELPWAIFGLMKKIAIIGAGIAGLACAQVLSQAGHHVQLFDKGRGPGGRMATRRAQTELGEVSFDHGAQYFTARDPAFVSLVQDLISREAVAPWTGELVRLAGDGTNKPLTYEPIYVGVPGMNGVIRALAAPLKIQWGTRVEAINQAQSTWQLTTDTGANLGNFDAVVCAVPAEQVAPLLQVHAPDLVKLATLVTSLPCWTGMFAFDAPLANPFDAMRLEAHDVIDFIAMNHSKPSRTGPASYVVQARADWSKAHLEESAESVAATLLDGLLAFSDNRPKLIYETAHRWRFARVEVENGQGYGFDRDKQIGVCGDWLLGPRIEAAWLSGHRLGLRMTGEGGGSKTLSLDAGEQDVFVDGHVARS
jgi:renalase